MLGQRRGMPCLQCTTRVHVHPPAIRSLSPMQGDRVFALVQYRPHVHAGAYAEYASVPEQQLACMPGGSLNWTPC